MSTWSVTFTGLTKEQADAMLINNRFGKPADKTEWFDIYACFNGLYEKETLVQDEENKIIVNLQNIKNSK